MAPSTSLMVTAGKVLVVITLDTDGKFPPELGDKLVHNALDNDLKKVDRIFRIKHPKTGETRPALYISGQTRESPAGNIILASPWIYDGKRAVVYCDLSGEFIAETEFERLLEKSLKDSGGSLHE